MKKIYHVTIGRSLKAACLSAVCSMLLVPAFAEDTYLGPTAVVASPDGTMLFVAETDAKRLAMLDPSGKVIRSVEVPAAPTGIAVSADGATAYVTCAAPQSTVCVVEVKSGKIVASIPVGHTAIGPALSPDGKTLYVCNRFDHDVSTIDLTAGKETGRIAAIREPHAAAITPDGKSVYVINHLPMGAADNYDISASVTVIDTASNTTSAIRLPNGSSSVRGICISPDGRHVYATHILGRYQMPTTQLERGWMNTNALSVIDAENRKLINTVLLDDVELGAANPWGVASTADGALICVTHAGTHELSIIDAKALQTQLAGMSSVKKIATETPLPPDNRNVYDGTAAEDVPNDLAFLVGMRRRVSLDSAEGEVEPDMTRVNGPRGLAIIGNRAFAACYFSDNLAEVDLVSKSQRVVRLIPLGPKPKLTEQRRGEMLFNDASICFQQWQSCASCHPDARVDTLNWDLMNDGARNPKNVKSMLLAHRTPPSMISAIRANAEAGVRAGLRFSLFAVRPEADAKDIDEYLKALTPVPSPHLVDGKLSPAAERGREIFSDKEVGCAKCHPGPLYTDLKMHDVGSRGQFDRRDTFDTPALVECWRTAPYMHDGHYTTVKELFTEGLHGEIGDLSPQQIDDLVEFVLSL
jgi:YVTN family beta-propeller protein